MNEIKDKTHESINKVKVARCKLANLKLTTYVIVRHEK